MVNQTHPYKKSEMYITEYPEPEPSILEVMLDCKTDSPSVKTETDVIPEEEIKLEINTDIVDPPKVKKKKHKEKIKKSKRILKMESEEKEKNDEPVRFKQKGRYFETKENMTNFQRIFDCDIKVLSKEEQVQDIKERRDGFNYPYRCGDCFKGFMDEANLTKHNLSWHDVSRGAAVCDVCKIRYKDKRDLNRHLKSHRLKFTCRQCNHVCKNTSKAMEHFKMHGGQLYRCDHCGKTYEKQSTYLTHMRVVHPSALIWCELCGESFVSNFGLNGHKKQAHKELKYPPNTTCSKCNTQFMTTEALRRHADADCEIASCVHCGEGFTTRLLLKDHLTTHRPTTVVGNFPCVKCNKTFPRQNLYSAHYRRVHADSSRKRKQFMCELCGKALPNKCELRYHQRTHTGERPFACPHCPKSFIKRAFMKAHMRVHSTERPFACKLCPKTFKGPAALSGHQYVHTGIKPPVRRKKKVPYVIDTTFWN
ncbi:gastrula zinc finger protein XlCGF26.1 isoform X2 [Manduca sexta]|uniref:C2H2-type domain-containing protein n=2 Tax=Manduca sexta TaxID=7130 RepID=A0A921ZV02_MANSE|nr:gastrula zinc finger protein XlCGF26.1 isoform X2 [Manduca sexta]KAG6463457.1 hypothetical protein O3G_MSEX013885 [Manduca sexta]